jgi:hypothetical protein
MEECTPDDHYRILRKPIQKKIRKSGLISRHKWPIEAQSRGYKPPR